MPTSTFIDANGATYHRRVSGAGTPLDPYITDVNVVNMPAGSSGDKFILIPKSAADISVTTTLSTVLILDVKALKTVSLTLRNTGATNALTGFAVSGTRGTSYNQSSILASTNADYTTLMGVSSGNPHARIIQSDRNPRTLAPSTDTSLVINVADIVSLVLSSTSVGTTLNYEGIALVL